MTKEHIVDVLHLAGLTPSMPFLPSWVPNWGHCPQLYETYSDKSQRLAQSYPEIASNTKSRRLIHSYSLLKFVPHPEAKHAGIWGSPQFSNTGHLKIQGVYLGTASQGKTQIFGNLRLSNNISTVNFKPFYHKMRLHSQPPLGKREQSVFLLADYSTILALAPSNSIGEYLLVRTVVDGRVTLSIKRPTNWTPSAFCLLPFLDNELACMKEIVAQPNSFSYLGAPPKLLSWAESLLHVQSLLSRGYPVVNAEERRLWNKWLEMKPRGFQILRNENKLQSTLNEVQSLEKTWDWENFHGDVLWQGCKFRCFISNYLTLFILDPLELKNRNSECPRQDDDSVDLSGAYLEESPLEYLREWAKVFFLLLGYISGEIQNNPVSTESDIELDDIDLELPKARGNPFLTKEDITYPVDFPGGNLSETAHKTWEQHFEAWRPLFSTKRGSFASIMLEKILDQWLEQTRPEPKIKSTAKYQSGKYWDWDWMENTMNQRMQISEELDRLHTRLLQHTGSVNLDLMCDKIFSRHVLGLDGLENMPVKSITII